jgi:hypothetical protein
MSNEEYFIGLSTLKMSVCHFPRPVSYVIAKDKYTHSSRHLNLYEAAGKSFRISHLDVKQ